MAYPSAEELGSAGLRIEPAGPVLTVVLDRPEVRNAQTPAMWRALAAIGAGRSDDVRVVVLRGEGEAFSAGLDRAMLTPAGLPGEPSLLELASGPDGQVDAAIDGFQQAFSWWHDPQIVSIAAVQGAAVGAGFQLALACDLRVVAHSARLSMREPALGLVPDLGGTGPLVDLIGYARALEVCATSRWVDAEEAAAIGLATATVREADLLPTVADLVAAVLETDAGALRATKRLLQEARRHTLTEQLRAEREAQVQRLRELAARMRGT